MTRSCKAPLAFIAIVAAGLLGWTARAQAPFDKLQRDQARAMLKDVHDALKKNYFDPNFRGVDIEGHGPLPTQAAASEAYAEAVEDSIWEYADSFDAVLALVEFAGVIAADNLAGEALREIGPIASERDAFAQIIALANAGQWLNQHAMDDWITRRKEAFGPSGLRPGGEGRGFESSLLN